MQYGNFKTSPKDFRHSSDIRRHKRKPPCKHITSDSPAFQQADRRIWRSAIAAVSFCLCISDISDFMPLDAYSMNELSKTETAEFQLRLIPK